MAKQKKNQIQIGERVSYSLGGTVLFTGTVIRYQTAPGLKPYVIKADDGTEKYAHECYLTKLSK